MWLALAGFVVVLIGLFGWGWWRLRHGRQMALAAIAQLRLEDIDRLRQECEAVFRDKLGAPLDLHDYERSARLLSDHIDNSGSIKGAFERGDFYWYFVLPMGAYIGELLRLHAGGVWQADPQGPKMELRVGAASATAYPFDKVVKQATIGDKGDLYAYFKSALALEQVAAQIPDRPDGGQQA